MHFKLNQWEITLNVYFIIFTDKEPPSIDCPMDMTVCTDPGECSANVDFSVNATDNCDENPWITCNHPSGSSFDVGNHTVMCSAEDESGNRPNCSFYVTLEGKLITRHQPYSCFRRIT